MQKHLEFFTFTFISNLDESDLTQWCAIPTEIKQNSTLVAIHMRVEKYDASKDICSNLEKLFKGDGFFVDDVYRDLLGSRVSNEKALVWTPFWKYKDGHNRVLIRNINLNAARLGRLVRRMLEIETYVFMALCNYNDARSQIGWVKDEQDKLAEILKNKKRNFLLTYLNRIFPMLSVYKTVKTYKELESTAKNISEKISSTQFKFNASIAYADLVWQGVKELKETRIEGWSRIGYFLERNFRPAVRTCASAISCQNTLSENVGQAAQLLGSKVDLLIASLLLFLAAISTIYYFSQILHCFGFSCFGLK